MVLPPADGWHAHLPPSGPGRVDDVDPTARPGAADGDLPEPFPTAPERVAVSGRGWRSFKFLGGRSRRGS